MKTQLLSFLILLFTIVHSTAQVTYQKAFGGNDFDAFYGASLTSDSGYIMTGFTTSFGAGMRDLFLVRTDAFGDTLWTGVYGGTESEEGFSAVETFDGGFVVAGYTSSFGTSTRDIYLLKTNAIGNLIWSKRFDSSADEWAYSIKQISDSGFILSGSTQVHNGVNDAFLMRLNSSGDTLWTYTYGTPDADVGFSVIQTYDGGFVFTGSTEAAFTNTNILLIKTHGNGGFNWVNSFGGNNIETGKQVMQLPDSSFAIAGDSGNDSTWSNYTLLRVDKLGSIGFGSVYDGVNIDHGTSFVRTPDGGYLIAGYSNSFGSQHNDVCIIRTNHLGNPLWTKTFGGLNPDGAESILPATENGYVLVGNTCTFGGIVNDGYMLRIDSSANADCNDTLRSNPGPFPGYTDVPVTFYRQSFAPSVFNTQTLISNGTLVYDVCLYDAIPESNNIHFEIYPNPSEGNFRVAFDKLIEEGSLEISNLLGEIILKIPVSNENQKQIQLGNVKPGIYFLNVEINGNSHTTKIIVE